jgi:hypothetical protein
MSPHGASSRQLLKRSSPAPGGTGSFGTDSKDSEGLRTRKSQDRVWFLLACPVCASFARARPAAAGRGALRGWAVLPHLCQREFPEDTCALVPAGAAEFRLCRIGTRRAFRLCRPGRGHRAALQWPTRGPVPFRFSWASLSASSRLDR